MARRILNRNQQVVRQWQLLTALQARGCTLKQLAREFDVTERTIRRDLEALQDAKFPLYNERHDDGVWRWHLMTGVAAPRRAA